MSELPISYATFNDMFVLSFLVYKIPIGKTYIKNNSFFPSADEKKEREKEIGTMKELARNINSACPTDEEEKHENEGYSLFPDQSDRTPQTNEIVNSMRGASRCRHFFYDLDNGLQCAITVSDKYKRVTVVFRGSDDAQDWLINLNAFKSVPAFDKDVAIHSGFLEVLASKRQEIFAAIDAILKAKLKSQGQQYDLFVTGHSLGGALATIFGYDMALKYEKQNVTVISFASPRTGNSAWRKKYNERENLTHFRVANNRDTVTCVLIIGFHHVGKTIYLTEGKSLYYGEDGYPWWKFSYFNCWLISDHFLTSYWERLKCTEKSLFNNSSKAVTWKSE